MPEQFVNALPFKVEEVADNVAAGIIVNEDGFVEFTGVDRLRILATPALAIAAHPTRY